MKKGIVFRSRHAVSGADFHLHTRLDKELSAIGYEKDFAARYISTLKQIDTHIDAMRKLFFHGLFLYFLPM